jgi:nucleoside-diphosphate-sugar epimerase
MDHYLVTGGAGFIGSHIVEALLHEGHQVRVLDNFSSGSRDNLRPFQKAFPRTFEIRRGDIRNKKTCFEAVRGLDYVIHQAAQISVPKSMENPEETQAVNMTGTLNLLSAARREKIRKLVLASSCAVYGDDPPGQETSRPKTESHLPNPLSPYALSKLVGEYYCRIFSNSFGLPAVALRYFNVFGPRQDPRSEYAAVIPKFISALVRRKAPTVFGDGKQSRDFVYVTDVVQANLKACHLPGVSGEVFNIAGGRSVNLLELLAGLQKTAPPAIRINFAPPRPGDVRHSRANIQKAKKVLGYRPAVSFQQGLKLTVASFGAGLVGV